MSASQGSAFSHLRLGTHVDFALETPVDELLSFFSISSLSNCSASLSAPSQATSPTTASERGGARVR